MRRAPKKYKFRRGLYAGLSAPWVAELVGCSNDQVRILLKQKLIELNKELQPKDIGDLVYEYRSKIPDIYEHPIFNPSFRM